jgi:hypothetical protein
MIITTAQPKQPVSTGPRARDGLKNFSPEHSSKKAELRINISIFFSLKTRNNFILTQRIFLFAVRQTCFVLYKTWGMFH